MCTLNVLQYRTQVIDGKGAWSVFLALGSHVGAVTRATSQAAPVSPDLLFTAAVDCLCCVSGAGIDGWLIVLTLLLEPACVFWTRSNSRTATGS